MECCARSLNNADESEINGIPVSITNIANDEILKYDSSLGVFRNQPDGVGVSSNIYNTDGALTGPRSVTLGANDLTFNGAASLSLQPGTNTATLAATNTSVGQAAGTLTMPHLTGSVVNSVLVTDAAGVITAAATPIFSAAQIGDGTNTDQQLIEFQKGLPDNYELNYHASLYGDPTLVGLQLAYPQGVGPQQNRGNFNVTGVGEAYIGAFATDLFVGTGGIEYGTNDQTTFVGGKKMRHYLDATANIAGLTYRASNNPAATLQSWTLDPANSQATEYNIANASLVGNVTVSNAGQFVCTSTGGFNCNTTITAPVHIFSSNVGYLRGESASGGGWAIGSSTAVNGDTVAIRVGGFTEPESGLYVIKTASGTAVRFPNISSFPQASPTHVITSDTLGNMTLSTVAEVVSPLVSSTIYNGNGTLTGNRLVDGGGNALSFSNMSAFTATGITGTAAIAANAFTANGSLGGTITIDNSGIQLLPTGSKPVIIGIGNLDGNNTTRAINFQDPTGAQDLATKSYVDGNSAQYGEMIIAAPPTTFGITTAPLLFGGAMTLTKGQQFTVSGFGTLRYDGFTTLDFLINLSITLENTTVLTTRDVIVTVTLNGANIPGAEARMSASTGNDVSTNISIIRELSTNDTLSANIQLASGGGITINVFNFTLSAVKV